MSNQLFTVFVYENGATKYASPIEMGFPNDGVAISSYQGNNHNLNSTITLLANLQQYSVVETNDQLSTLINTGSGGLGYTPENVANKTTDGTLSANSDVLYPSEKAVKTYVDSSVVGLLNDRGNYDASSNLYPSSGGSGSAGAIKKGDLWYISVAGTLGGTSVVVGSSLRALVDTPAQTSGNWDILNAGIGFTPENVANKSTDVNFTANSNQLYPTQRAVKTLVSTKIPLVSVPTVGNLPQLLVDGSLEDSGSKISTDVTLASNSNHNIPTEKAVKTYVDAHINALPYKLYSAVLNQSSGGAGGAITYTELVNQFGSAGVWFHNNVGTYSLTFDTTGLLVNFNGGKVFMGISLTNGSGYDVSYNLSLSNYNNQIYLLARRLSAFYDNSLDGVIVEIRVYN